MQLLSNIGSLIQNEVLGMDWLYRLVSDIIVRLGYDPTTKLAGSVHFFVYDVIKITILLCTLIFLISYVQTYFTPERSRKLIGRSQGLSAYIIAALIGTVTPFCSCSSIPIFIGFTAAGLPLGVTFAFLISSPMVDLGSLVLLTGVFGAPVAFLYVLFGLVIAVIGGYLIGRARLEGEIEDFIRNSLADDLSIRRLKVVERLDFALYQMRVTFRKVFPFILLGVAIGALIHNWVPESWIVTLLGGDNPLGVVLATLVGVPIYADIFGVIPIAEALLFKGAQLGTVLAFMMAVTTLSLPSLIMLRRAVKPKLLVVFVAICTIGIILVGYVFNAIQAYII